MKTLTDRVDAVLNAIDDLIDSDHEGKSAFEVGNFMLDRARQMKQENNLLEFLAMCDMLE
jgi:hypothetical protein